MIKKLPQVDVLFDISEMRLKLNWIQINMLSKLYLNTNFSFFLTIFDGCKWFPKSCMNITCRNSDSNKKKEKERAWTGMHVHLFHIKLTSLKIADNNI
jgi:hypothetical protein